MSSRSSRIVKIIATGMTKLQNPQKKKPSNLMAEALITAINSINNLFIHDIDGLIAVPSLADPHFMEAHYVATEMGILPSNKGIVVRTVDTGGAGPITALLQAKRMIGYEGVSCVAVVAGDTVRQLSSKEFLKRADQTCWHPKSNLRSPVIPTGYNRIAQYQMKKFNVTREELASCSAAMSIMASRHPNALTKSPRSVQEILDSPKVASVTNLLECARRADGAASFIVASNSFLDSKGMNKDMGAVVIGGAESSGPLYPPSLDEINEEMFSCDEAMRLAYEEAQISVRDVDFFGLYDCYPICLIRAIEAVGLAKKGYGGKYIMTKYQELLKEYKNNNNDPNNFRPQDILPINTHGGLLAFGAPWEVPAMYNVIEAFEQIMNKAGCRQIQNVKRALVYGNGGIFSHSAVAILGNGRY